MFDTCTCVRVCVGSVCPLPAHANGGVVPALAKGPKTRSQGV